MVFRFAFLPIQLDFFSLYLEDKASFDYLYCQSLADLLTDSVFIQINAQIALRLLCLRVEQLYLMVNCSSNDNSNQQPTSKSSNDSKSNSSGFLKKPTNFFSSVRSSVTNSSSNSANNNNNTNSRSSITASCESTTNNGITTTNQQHYDVSADQAASNSKKWIKQMESAYGLEAFVPLVLIKKLKKKQIINMFSEVFKENHSQLIPLVAQQFTKFINDHQQQFNQNNEMNSINNRNSIVPATYSVQSLLANASTTNKKSVDLKKIRINEDLIKLCFLVLFSEVQWFGVHTFSLRNSINDFRVTEVLNGFDKAILERLEQDKQTNGKNGHLYKQQSRVGVQVWLSPRIGICQVVRSSTIKANPYVLAKLDEVIGIKVTRFEGCYLNVEIKLKVKMCNEQGMMNSIFFIMEEKDAREFIVCLNTFYALQYKDDNKQIPIEESIELPWWSDLAPNYATTKHTVKPSLWSYPAERLENQLENGLDLFSLVNHRPVLDLNSLYNGVKTIDLSQKLPAYSKCIDDDCLTKNSKFYFDSKGDPIDYLNDNHWSADKLNNNSISNEFIRKEQESKYVQHDSDFLEDEEYSSSKEDQEDDDSSEQPNNSQLSDGQFNGVKADEKDIYLHLTNQESLSDSDPISNDLPMPGQLNLKATDSLLLLNQIGNDDTIMSKFYFRCVFSSLK